MIEKIEEKISGKNNETKKLYEKDLDRIKKLYGEGMARFCRANLSSILDDPGELPRLMEKFFAPSRILCDTIKDNNIDQFCDFMLGEYFYEKGDTQEFVEDIGTPEEVFDKAGYKFYHCKTVEDVEQFIKYYASGEAICTFNNIEGRLHSNDIFWAVKKDVDEIKREDFENPERQDRYGTSVISLQFHKSDSHKLSIKNRYNHAVSGCNCDATFSNNLDNIYKGLAHSFEKHYGLKQNFPREDFYLYNQVRDMEGRFHTYNVKIGDYYFCNDNVIIKRDRGIDACSMPEKENYKYIELDKARYEVVENYIIDKKEKTIKTLHEFTESYVVDRTEKKLKDISAEIDPTMTGLEIEQIEVTRVKGTTDKIIHIIAKGDIKLDLTINANNQIVEVFNSGLEYVEPGFLQHCSNIKKFTALDLKKLSSVNMESLEVVNLPAIEEGGNYFLDDARNLKEAYLPNLKTVGRYFLYHASELEKLDVPSLTRMGECSLMSDKLKEVSLPSLVELDDYCFTCLSLEKFDAPKLEKVGKNILDNADQLKEINIPSLREVGNNFLPRTKNLEVFNAPSLEIAGDGFLESANGLKEFHAKNLREAGTGMLCGAQELKVLNAPSLKVLNFNSLVHINLEELSLPSLEKIGEYCLGKIDTLKTINLPKLKTVATGCFQFASNIEEIVLPVLTDTCEGFFKYAPNLERIILPSLKALPRYSFENVKNLKKLYAPNLREIQNFSFTSVPRLKEATLTNLEMVGDWSFGQMSALERLDFPNLIEVGGGCFSEARSLQQLSMPKVELIKEFAFDDIDKVQYLNLPNLRVIGKGCFDNARNLQRLYAPNISYLRKNNFHTTQKLESVTLTNLQEMDELCFHETNLEKLYFPNLRIMKDGCFHDARQLKSVNLPSLQEASENCFIYTEALEDVKLPNLTEAPSYFMANADGVKSFRAENLRKLGENALRFLCYSKDLDLDAPKLEELGENALESALKNADAKVEDYVISDKLKTELLQKREAFWGEKKTPKIAPVVKPKEVDNRKFKTIEKADSKSELNTFKIQEEFENKNEAGQVAEEKKPKLFDRLFKRARSKEKEAERELRLKESQEKFREELKKELMSKSSASAQNLPLATKTIQKTIKKFNDLEKD